MLEEGVREKSRRFRGGKGWEVQERDDRKGVCVYCG